MNKEKLSQPIPLTIKLLIFKFGNLLLKQENKLGKWALLRCQISSNEDVNAAIYKTVLNQSGWETTNLRLFQINASSNIEVVFIIDAVKQTLQSNEKTSNLRWFQIIDIPNPETLAIEDSTIIQSFANLVHPGKTLDLEHLPPIFNLKKQEEESFPQLLRLICPTSI